MNIRTIAWLVLAAACNNTGSMGSTGDASGGGADGGGGSGGSGSNVAGTGVDSWTSGSRIKTRTSTATTADGASYTAFGGFFDSQLDTACYAETAADGVTRCLPLSFPYSLVYADSSCSEAALQVACSVSATYVYKTTTGSACPSPTEYHEYAVGSALGLTAVYDLSGSDCYAGTLPAGYALYSAGAEVPASAFAEMTVTTN